MTTDETATETADWRPRPWQASSPRAAFAANTIGLAQSLAATIRGAAQRIDRRDGDGGPGAMPFTAFSEALRSRYETGPDARHRAELPSSGGQDTAAAEAMSPATGVDLGRPASTAVSAVPGDTDRPLAWPPREAAPSRRGVPLETRHPRRLGRESAPSGGGDGEGGARGPGAGPADRPLARRSSGAAVPSTRSEALDADLQDQVSKIERGSFGIVSHRLKTFLGGLLSFRVPNVKLYDNPAADRFARRFDADAVTYGDKILFRTGKLRPRAPDGLALLAHEITHAAGGAGHRRGGGPANPAQAEEQTALMNESTVLHHAVSLERGGPDAAPVPAPRYRPDLPMPAPVGPAVPSAAAAPDGAVLPKAAQSGRDIAPLQDPPAPRQASEAPLSPQQLNQVYDFLKDKVREEGERIGV